MNLNVAISRCLTVRKRELIEGVVYVASSLRYSSHGQPHSDIMTWLGVYRAATVRYWAG